LAAAPADAPPANAPSALPHAAGERPTAPVTRLPLPALLAGLQPRGRPVLVHHWASWDEPSTDGLTALRALVAERGLDAVGVAWDELVDAPLGRIAGMAQRPARWAGGEQAAAWVREAGLSWPTLVYAVDHGAALATGAPFDPAEAFFAALGLADRYVPQVTLYDTDGAVLAHHGGPLVGARWEAFCVATATAAVSPAAPPPPPSAAR